MYSRKASTSTLASASSSSGAIQLDSEVIATAFALDSLRNSQHLHASELSDEVARTVQAIVVTNLRPATVRRSQEASRDTRNSSTEPLSYPAEWAIDKPSLRKAVKQFIKQTVQYRQSQAYRSLQPVPRDQPPVIEADSPSSHSPSDSTTPDRQAKQPSVAPRIASRFLPEGSIDDSPVEQARVRLSRASSFSSLIGEESDSVSTGHRPTRATTGTSAEEAIYNRPLGPEQQTESMPTLSDEDIQRIVDRAITNYVQQNPSQSGPPGVPGDRGPSGLDGLNGMNAGTSRFQPKELGFFNPTYQGKTAFEAAALENSAEGIIYRDVFTFISRAKNFAAIHGAELIRNNLYRCLQDDALAWHTNLLSSGEQRLLILGDGLVEWETALVTEYKEPAAKAMKAFASRTYTMEDAENRRLVREYAQDIIRLGKAAELPLWNQLLQIWNGLEVDFQLLVPKPTKDTRMSDFLRLLNDKKDA